MPQLKITDEQTGERLDVILARMYPQYSRAFLQKVVRHGGVTRRGAASEPKYRVHAGEIFDIADLERQGDHGNAWTEADQDLQGHSHAAEGVVPRIIFEDQSILVIDKPAGLVVHPAAAHRGATLIDWVRKHLGQSVVRVFTDPERLGLVHRLDKETSGVLVIAKSVLAQTAISRQFYDRSIKKTYAAFVEGRLSAPTGVITAPVGRSRKNPARMAVSNQGRPSETAFEVEEAFQEVSQVKLHPKTGRTHQLRVHLSAIGHPILGDGVYGSGSGIRERLAVKRVLLHAERLELTHPDTRKKVEFHAPWPADFKQMQKKLRAAMAVFVVMTGMWTMSSVASADDATAPATAAVKKPVHHPSVAAGATGTTAAALRSLKKDVASLNADLEALKQKVDGIQSSLNDLDVQGHLDELGKAISDINAKAVGSVTSSEETKTQMLDVQRKLKAQSDAVDQMRDQLDRLQRELIQTRTDADANNNSPPPAAATTPIPPAAGAGH